MPASGNNTHATVEVDRAQHHSENAQTAIQFLVDTAGASPTVTWQVSGSLDGTNWYPVNYVTDASDTAAVTAIASTAVGAKVIYLANAPSRQYRYFRIVTTLNTNVTYHAELYAFGY